MIVGWRLEGVWEDVCVYVRVSSAMTMRMKGKCQGWDDIMERPS